MAKWSGFYASGFAPWDAHRPASQLVAFLHDHPEGQRLLPPERSSTSAEVLEIGCGSGASCVWMAQQGMAVVGVDLVPLPLRAASAAATAAGVADRCRFVASDFMALPNSFSFAVGKRMSHEQQDKAHEEEAASGDVAAEREGGGFDLVYDCQCFHVLRKEIGERPVADKIAQLVRPGGIFFTLVGNCNEAMTGPERLTKEELTDAFASHFEVLSIYETRFDMTEHYRENLPQPPLAWCGIFKKKKAL